MMDREHGAQQKMLCVTMESLMPEKHFLRDLDRLVDFSFVYDKVAELYSNTGRRSVDPVVIVKMMLLGYLYGIDSERRLEQEVQVNIAYRWFLGINLDEPVPDHSTFSQLRRRKFNGTTLFEDVFEQVVRLCMQEELERRIHNLDKEAWNYEYWYEYYRHAQTFLELYGERIKKEAQN